MTKSRFNEDGYEITIVITFNSLDVPDHFITRKIGYYPPDDEYDWKDIVDKMCLSLEATGKNF